MDHFHNPGGLIAEFQQRQRLWPITHVDDGLRRHHPDFDKLNTQVASGSPPDLMQMDMRHLPTYAGDLPNFGEAVEALAG